MDKFKAGDRVYWTSNSNSESDVGTVVEKDGSIYHFWGTDTFVWVKWDSDGEVLHAPEDTLQFEQCVNDSNSITEEKAVMFLLNLGYTVTKEKK